MASINVYKVNYHFEASGKLVNHPQVRYVAAAANDYGTISSVIANGTAGTGGSGLGSHGGATLVIDSVVNAIPVSAQE